MILPFLHSRFELDDAPSLMENNAFGFSIHQVRPKKKNFQLLVTNGLSAYNQPVTESSAAYRNIELYFCLPEYWDLQKKNWPLTWLSMLGQIPQKNKTWFGPGDTIPAGRPPEPIDAQLPCEYFILSPPVTLAGELHESPGFSMLAVIPIFRKEFDYKVQQSGTLLLNKMRAKDIDETVDIYRQPVARRKFMGLF